MRSYDKFVLKPLHGKIKHIDIASYDIETHGRDNEFLLGGFIGVDGKYKSFWNKDDMIKYMTEHIGKNTWVYATNNKFDYTALFKHTKEYLKDKPLLRGGLLMHSRYKHMHFYDTLSYCKSSVENIGKILGKPKIKFDVSKNKRKELMTAWEKRKMIAYNKRDCEITREFMQGFQELTNKLGGNLKMTIGSCSIDLYRRKYLKENIHHEYIINNKFYDKQTVRDFIFSAYHGGRTEMFSRGYSDKKWFKYDFNSMYSSVMTETYPKPSSAHMCEDIDGKLNVDTIIKYEGVSECEVIMPYTYYPILPLYMNNKLCFPIGKFRGVFTNIELRNAVKNGCRIISIYKQVYYTKTFNPFNDYVNDLYKYKEKYTIEKNDVFREVIKLYLNNLYGKFGQHNLMETIFYNYSERNDDDLSQDGIIFDEQAGFGYKEYPIDRKPSFVIPIFAVYTTAKARIKLYNELVKLRGIYADTDSIITEHKILSSTKLGELKLESELKSINIAKQKHYKETLIDDTIKYKIKGLRMSKIDDEYKRKIEKEQQFEQSITGQNIRQMHIIGIKEAVRRSKHVNAIEFVTKKFDLKDDKRVWIKPYDKNIMQHSEPLIIGFSSVNELMESYQLL